MQYLQRMTALATSRSLMPSEAEKPLVEPAGIRA